MADKSPFATTRFEFDSNNVYYLDDGVFNRLQRPKPVYIIGSRGTGKTTLLKALSWDERTTNASLQSHLGPHPLVDGVLGLYLKVPEIQFQLLQEWTDVHVHGPKGTAAQLASRYLDMYWIEALVLALIGLRQGRHLNFSFSDEADALSEISRQQRAAGQFVTSATTLADFLKYARSCRRSFEQRIQKNAGWEEILEVLGPLDQPGEFGRRVAIPLLQLVSQSCHLKVGLDEAEAFSKQHQLMINGWTRTTSWPIFPTVSFVSAPDDIVHTHLSTLTTGHADREVIELDAVSEPEFRKFAEGVATARLRRVGVTDVDFSASRVFGPLRINESIENLLTRSVSEESQQLIERAKEIQNTPVWQKCLPDMKRLPLWQSYAIDALQIKAPATDPDSEKSIPQFRAEMRKKSVAAYLGLCSKLDLKPRYAGWRMLIGMSDLCIRDFLTQLDAAFIATDRAVIDFCKEELPLEDQWRALDAASAQKHQSIQKIVCGSPRFSLILVEAIGRITAYLQSSHEELEHLKSPERGMFEVSLPEKPLDTFEKLLDLIHTTAEAGLIRTERAEGPLIRFRLHRSFAAYFGFSYRGPYHTVALDWRDLNRIVHAESVPVLKREINTALEHAGAYTPQLGLFEGKKK